MEVVAHCLKLWATDQKVVTRVVEHHQVNSIILQLLDFRLF